MKHLLTYLLVFFLIMSCGSETSNPDPEITGIQPEAGAPCTMVTITGSGFTTDHSIIDVQFSGRSAELVDATVSRIEAKVPKGAETGPVRVSVGEKSVTGPNFTVQPQIRNQVLFQSNPEVDIGDADIFIMKPDGSQARRLIDTDTFESFPTVSSNGTKVAFRRSDTNNLYIMNADGSEITQLTNFQVQNQFVFTISWSPDDSQIVFAHGSEEDAEIYVINADGTGIQQITDDDAWNRGPDWSPDGSRIVFDSNRDGDFEIYMIDPDGGSMEKITNDSHDNYAAEWSPDGSELIITSNRNNFFGELYRMNVEGSNIQRITREGGSYATWSPNGTELIYQNQRNLYKINADGSDSSQQLTSYPDNAYTRNPSWSPVK